MTTLETFSKLEQLKKEWNAVILAHYYQVPDIQYAADFIGGSLAFSQYTSQVESYVIFFCGVHFMYEIAKILNPEKQVILPDISAGCFIADSTPADQFKACINLYLDHIIINYNNCIAEVKSMLYFIYTS